MSFYFKDLSEKIRGLMLEEMKMDIDNNTLYLSKRFSDEGAKAYPQLLCKAIQSGSVESLTESLRGKFNLTELKERNGRPYEAKVPVTAAKTLAEGEFNRFYIRAICRYTIETGGKLVKIYRAKSVSKPRKESDDKIGTTIEAARLLADLRNHTGTDTALGLPPGPNSGLSVEIIYNN